MPLTVSAIGTTGGRGAGPTALGINRLNRQAKAFAHSSEGQRSQGEPVLECRRPARGRPYLGHPCPADPNLADPTAGQARLCRRVEKHIKELFFFLAHREARPADPPEGAAERSRRQPATSRKISGGTRSQQGADTGMTLASTPGGWRAQGLNPLTPCRQPLVPPHV